MTGVPKPIIPVILFNISDDINDPDSGIGMGMLVDSGADITTISETTAEILGIDLTAAQTSSTSGIGGSNIPVRVTEVVMILQRGGEAYKFITMVQIINDVNLKYSLLGRDFIFSRFDITFRERKNRVEFLRKNNDGIKKISPINR
ncbi:MAG: aspartyl protease family protein [Thermoplasmata archaeon]|nr:aspartyl protease family protein [Thermoplasmata archaeon]